MPGEVGLDVILNRVYLERVSRHTNDIGTQAFYEFGVVDREDVWAPFLASGLTARDWGSIADDVARAKPIAIALLGRMLDAALDDVAGTLLLSAATEAERALGEP
jgi:hypothetical protein